MIPQDVPDPGATSPRARAPRRPHPARRRAQGELGPLGGAQRRHQRGRRAAGRHRRRRLDPRARRPAARHASRSPTTRPAWSPPAGRSGRSTAAGSCPAASSRSGCRSRGSRGSRSSSTCARSSLGRTGWSRFGALILISGAFGLFRRDVIVEVGGLDPDSIGEDFELVMRIHRRMIDEGRDYRVEFVPEPVCWTEVPSTLAVLAPPAPALAPRAVGDALGLPRHAAGGRATASVGFLALPVLLGFELFAPLLEVFGIVVVLLGLALGSSTCRTRPLPRARLRPGHPRHARRRWPSRSGPSTGTTAGATWA